MHNAATRIVSESGTRALARMTRLRQRMYGVQGAADIADRFARELAASWRAGGLDGCRMACADLAADLADVPGAYDCFAEARALSAV